MPASSASAVSVIVLPATSTGVASLIVLGSTVTVSVTAPPFSNDGSSPSKQ